MVITVIVFEYTMQIFLYYIAILWNSYHGKYDTY